MHVQSIVNSVTNLPNTDIVIIQRQPKYTDSTTRQAEILHLPCLLTCFKISPIALFNRVASLNSLLNSIVSMAHACIIRMIMQYKPVLKKTKKQSTLLHEQHYLKYES